MIHGRGAKKNLYSYWAVASHKFADKGRKEVDEGIEIAIPYGGGGGGVTQLLFPLSFCC